MIIVLILIFCLITILRNSYRIRQCPNNYIRWDLYEKQIYKIVCFFCGIFGLLPCIAMWAMGDYIFGRILNSVSDWMMIYVVVIAPFILFVGIYAGIRVIQSKIYLSRLEANGYIVPQHAKDYDYNLTRLINKSGNNVIEYPRDSKIHTILTGIGFIGCVVASVCYYITWHDLMPGTVRFFMVCAGILDILWLLNIYLYYRRCNVELYRDCTTPDDGRKVRKELVGGIVSIIVAVLVSVFCIYFAYFSTRYVYRVQVSVQEREIK